jgi:hypothetical protein
MQKSPPMWQFVVGAIVVFIILALLFGSKEIIQMIKG